MNAGASTIDEFDLIRRHFTSLPGGRGDVVRGIGDDGAILTVVPGMRVASVILGAGAAHAELDAARAHGLGEQLLRDGIGRLEELGARAAWFTLALSLPEPSAAWLDAFTAGLRAEIERSGAQLIGGDTTRGPLRITLCAHGLIDAPPDDNP